MVNLGVGLPDWIAMTRALIAHLPEADQTAIAQGTARRLYGLGSNLGEGPIPQPSA